MDIATLLDAIFRHPLPAALIAGIIVLAILIIAIRPRRLTPRQIEHRAYLRTETWKRLRAEALSRDGRRCRGCNGRSRLDVHHRYYPAVLGTESVDALTTLCRACHDAIEAVIRRP